MLHGLVHLGTVRLPAAPRCCAGPVFAPSGEFYITFVIGLLPLCISNSLRGPFVNAPQCFN